MTFGQPKHFILKCHINRERKKGIKEGRPEERKEGRKKPHIRSHWVQGFSVTSSQRETLQGPVEGTAGPPSPAPHPCLHERQFQRTHDTPIPEVNRVRVGLSFAIMTCTFRTHQIFDTKYNIKFSHRFVRQKSGVLFRKRSLTNQNSSQQSHVINDVMPCYYCLVIVVWFRFWIVPAANKNYKKLARSGLLFSDL